MGKGTERNIPHVSSTAILHGLNIWKHLDDLTQLFSVSSGLLK